MYFVILQNNKIIYNYVNVVPLPNHINMHVWLMIYLFAYVYFSFLCHYWFHNTIQTLQCIRVTGYTSLNLCSYECLKKKMTRTNREMLAVIYVCERYNYLAQPYQNIYRKSTKPHGPRIWIKIIVCIFENWSMVPIFICFNSILHVSCHCWCFISPLPPSKYYL